MFSWKAKPGQSLTIGGIVKIVAQCTDGGAIRIGIEAPEDMRFAFEQRDRELSPQGPLGAAIRLRKAG